MTYEQYIFINRRPNLHLTFRTFEIFINNFTLQKLHSSLIHIIPTFTIFRPEFALIFIRCFNDVPKVFKVAALIITEAPFSDPGIILDVFFLPPGFFVVPIRLFYVG